MTSLPGSGGLPLRREEGVRSEVDVESSRRAVGVGMGDCVSIIVSL